MRLTDPNHNNTPLLTRESSLGFRRFLLAALTLPLLWTLTSCATYNLEKRRTEHPGVYESLSAEHQALVNRGEIAKEMSPQAVLLALGNPSEIQIILVEGNEHQVWSYFRNIPQAHGYWRPTYDRYGRRSYTFTEIARPSRQLLIQVHLQEDRVIRFQRFEPQTWADPSPPMDFHPPFPMEL